MSRHRSWARQGAGDRVDGVTASWPTADRPGKAQRLSAWPWLGLPAALLLITVLSLAMIYGLRFEQQAHGFATPIFAWLLFEQDELALWGLALVLALALLAHRSLMIVARASAESARWIGEFPWMASSVALPVLAAGAWWGSTGFHPLAMDEYAVWLQSQIFAKGQLQAHWPAAWLDGLVARPFQGWFLLVDKVQGTVASAYWPGHALLTSLFAWAGMPGLTNAVVTAATLGVAIGLGMTVTGDRRQAGWWFVLLLACPVIWAMAGSYYAMPTLQLMNMLFVWVLIAAPTRQVLASMGKHGAQMAAPGSDLPTVMLTGYHDTDTPSPQPATTQPMLFRDPQAWWQQPACLQPGRLALLMAGLVGGFALTAHNPLPHVLFALPWWWLLWRSQHGLRNLIWLGIGYLPMVIVLGGGWMMLRAEMAPAAAAVSASTPAGGAQAFLNTLVLVFQPPDADVLYARLAGLIKTWSWTVPGLLLLAAIGMYRARTGSIARYIGYSVLATLIGYCFVSFDQGHGWGFRYLHPVLFGLVALATIPMLGDDRSRLWMGVMAAVGLLLLTPMRLAQMAEFTQTHLAQFPPVDRSQKSVIFINPRYGMYTVDLVQNPVDLDRPAVVMVSRGEQRDAAWMAAQFPGAQKIWQDNGNSQWRRP